MIAEWKFSPSIALAGRVEYFSDPTSVVVFPITGVSGFECASAGLCLNVKITDHALFRLEGRSFMGMEDVFISSEKNPGAVSQVIISNLTVWF